MGTKRVGLARVEALIENLKRDLALGGASLSGGLLPTVSAAATATTTLTLADSGKVVLLAPNAANVVLPTPQVGMHFLVAQTGNYDTAPSTIKTPTTDGSVVFRGHVVAASNDDGNSDDTNSNDVISFGTATIPGDYVECIAISSTVWLVRGACKAATNGIVFADA